VSDVEELDHQQKEDEEMEADPIADGGHCTHATGMLHGGPWNA
jgi:hypothetical protein